MAENNEALLIEVGVEKLGTDGFAICPGLLRPDLVMNLVAEQLRRENAGKLAVAGIGRAGARTLDPSLRQARSCWLDGRSEPEREYLAFGERLRLAINRRLMLGLFEFEAQFLFYPPNGFYRRHLDSLRGTRNRVVSVVTYLNKGWSSADGGALAVWAAGAEDEAAPLVEVMPEAGVVVLMLAEEIPHEVLPARRERRAIAGWFRVNSCSPNRMDPARRH